MASCGWEFPIGGEPAVSYYRCNEYNPNNSNCDPNHDGLHYARRSGGQWNTQAVQATSVRCVASKSRAVSSSVS